MYIGTYGTLRYGEALHGAINMCSCSGLARISGNYIMVITPAGFPAMVEVSSGYLQMILRSDTLWWEQYKAAHPDVHDAAEWTGTANGFDYPLIELYNVNTNAIIRRLDMVEGVPHLYHRIGASSYTVKENTSERCSSDGSYETALKKFAAARPELTTRTSDSTHPYLEAYAMPAQGEWLQGCEIVWNGDFTNQIIHPTIRFDYVEWRQGINRGRPEVAYLGNEIERIRRRVVR